MLSGGLTHYCLQHYPEELSTLMEMFHTALSNKIAIGHTEHLLSTWNVISVTGELNGN